MPNGECYMQVNMERFYIIDIYHENRQNILDILVNMDLGGGLKTFCMFTPKIGGNDPI